MDCPCIVWGGHTYIHYLVNIYPEQRNCNYSASVHTYPPPNQTNRYILYILILKFILSGPGHVLCTVILCKYLPAVYIFYLGYSELNLDSIYFIIVQFKMSKYHVPLKRPFR